MCCCPSLLVSTTTTATKTTRVATLTRIQIVNELGAGADVSRVVSMHSKNVTSAIVNWDTS